MPETTARKNEQGVALVFTLFLLATLSALAVSMMFLAQTETSSSRNYKTMSQGRYAGEAGVHKAINYLINSYPALTSTAGFDATVSPVTYSGNKVVLSATTGVTSNYPDSAVVTAFNTAAKGSLAVGTGTVNYSAYATLLSMRQVTVYGGATYVIQTWQITGIGTIPNPSSTSASATVEVTATLERNYVNAETFAVFATDTGCGAITYTGSGRTDSYDSTAALVGGVPVISDGSGAVGTNGNLSIGGNVDIYGALSTPRTGVGSCTSGAVTALSETGANAHVHEPPPIRLPQSKAYPDPVIAAAGSMDMDFSSSTTDPGCDAAMLTIGWTCTVTSGGGNTNITLTPILSTTTTMPLRNVDLGSNVNLTINTPGCAAPCAVTLPWNSLEANGSASLALGSAVVATMQLTGAGLASGDPVVDFAGSFATTTFDPSRLQIQYAGTGLIKLRGNNELAATVYAPNAAVDMASSYAVYGSILAKRFTNSGGATVHYDRSLATKFKTLGSYVMTSFSWKKY